MIEQLRLSGRGGTIAWGYRTVAELGTWIIVRAVQPTPRRDASEKLKGKGWQLQAGFIRGEAFALRQKNLRFAAPRLHDKAGGFWSFALLEPPIIHNGILRAPVGAPER